MKKTLVFVLLTLTALSIFSACSYDPDAISVVSREDGSGTRGAFTELFKVEVKADGQRRDQTTKEAIIANNTSIMMINIQNDEKAIGYISMGSLNDSIKALAINGVAATAENVKNGEYVASRPFFIATKGELSELSKDFIDFVLSKEGQAIVASMYVSIDEEAPVYQGNMPSGRLVIGGSSAVNPVMEKLVEGYKLINTNASIEIQMNDSTGGIIGAINGIFDIAMSSRELRESELLELDAIAIAIDGMAVIVNNNNPLNSITKEEVTKIFTGELVRWNQVNR